MISITAMARTQLVNLARLTKSQTIVFSVKGGGCNGFVYDLAPGKRTDGDEGVVVAGDVVVSVDKMSQFYLIGTTIDYTQDFMGNRFTFENPNAVASCGCATSFTV
jgi:iron-sulfur cluster assembly accessory protein